MHMPQRPYRNERLRKEALKARASVQKRAKEQTPLKSVFVDVVKAAPPKITDEDLADAGI
jgi:hypothetical protein